MIKNKSKININLLLIIYFFIVNTIVKSKLINTNIGIISSCYYLYDDDLTCISLYLPSNYFIIKKNCFKMLLNENKAIYVHYNGKPNIINYMIEYNEHYYLKIDSDVYNFSTLNYISYVNTTRFYYLNNDDKNNIYSISYLSNKYLNITNLDKTSILYNELSFQHNIYDKKINYFNISIYPNNNITYIPEYVEKYNCDLYNFQLNYDHFYDDYCLIK